MGSDDAATVWFLAGDDVATLAPVGPAAGGEPPVEGLPLVVRPGALARWRSRAWRLDREGRYCFEDEGGMRNVIAFARDYVALFAALAQIHVKGRRHQALSVAERIEVARWGRLSVMCGGIASVALDLLAGLGQHARRVVMLHGPTRNAHVMVEYFAPAERRWVLVDIHNHALFVGPQGFMSLGDLVLAMATGAPMRVHQLTMMGGLDYFSWASAPGGEFGIASEICLYNTARARERFMDRKNLYGVYIDERTAVLAVLDPLETAKMVAVRPESYRCLPLQEWLQTVYDE